MSFLKNILRLIVLGSFSSAIHPFDKLREQNLYPATTYDISIPGGDNRQLGHITRQPGPRSQGSSELPPWGEVYCSTNELHILDCEAGINIIPTGHLIVDPHTPDSLGTIKFQDNVRFKANLPRPLPNFRLPAAFRAGTCTFM
jgi:hypothetical protein